MSTNLNLLPAIQAKIIQQAVQQAEAKSRLAAQNKAAARELLLRVQLILSRNQIK